MYHFVKSLWVFILLFVSSQSFATPCTEGNRSKHSLLKSCQIKSPSTEFGTEPASVNFCMSRINKDGGPFGGEPVPWFFTNVEIITQSGEIILYSFDNPDGRHNFRSPIDYSVLDLTAGEFYLESHRTSYPENQKNGIIDLHYLTFDFNSNQLTFEYRKRNGVMFGKWENKLKFEGSCTE